MTLLPCIICEGGAAATHGVCNDCQDLLIKREAVFESMVDFVITMNNTKSLYLSQRQVVDYVKPIYDKLCSINVWKEQGHENTDL